MNGVQVRNLFNVKNLVTSGNPTNPGDLKVVPFVIKLSGKDGCQLQYVNPDGELIVSDFIVKEQSRAEATTGVGTPLKIAVLSLDSAVNSGNPIIGQDYIVDILVHNYQLITDNSTLTKFGAVHATTAMATNKALFMTTLAKSFALNFRRDADVNVFFKFYTREDTNKTNPGVNHANWHEVTWDTKISTHITSYSNDDTLVVEEVEQPTWFRGTFPKQTVRFDLAPHTIYDGNGEEVTPFVVDDRGLVKIQVPTANGVTISNGYAMADLEYLCHGEIGDQLRDAGYPRNIRTKYSINDSDVTHMFDTVEVYFHYVGRNTSPEKSEKQITLAIDKTSSSTTASAVLAEIQQYI